MFYKKNTEKVLSKELFENPTSEYRGTPFWAWNCELEEEELLRQIEIFKEMGLGGFHMHVRSGLSIPYLGEEHMALVKACIEKARKEGMIAYLYDEDRWPSGSAGGLVTKLDDDYRQKELRLTVTPYVEANKTFTLEGTEGMRARTEEGDLITCFDIVLDENGCLKSYKQIGENDTAVGTKWYAYFDYTAKRTWFNNESYVDTLSKSAMDKFIDITYEAYDKTCGEDFGDLVPSIFTDEPQVARKGKMAYATDTEDVTLPWTNDFAETFKAAYGEDVIAGIPELFWELPDGKISTIRYHYHDHVAERFALAFADNCGKWCREHGLMLTGHMMEEPTLLSQTHAISEAMRHYRGFDMPGIDMLCDSYEFTTAKQTQSAVHQYGREAMMSELYGVTGWDYDFRGHKLQGDWQAALGVTVRVPHLSWVSMKGEAKRDYPASIHYQSSWYKEYSRVEDHFARVNTAMTRGKPIVKVGMIHPIESYWLHWGTNEQTIDVREAMDKKFKESAEWLVKGLIDYDYICESTLPALCEKGGAPLKVGEMEYDVIVVPECETLRSTTLDRLEAFRKKGGRLIFLGSAPTLQDAVPSKRGQKLYNKSEVVGYTKIDLLNALEDARLVSARYDDGGTAENLCYSLRQDGDKIWLFLAQSKLPYNKDVSTCKNTNISLKGTYKVTLWNTSNGEIEELLCAYKNGCTIVNRDMYEHDSLLLCYEEGKSEIASIESAEKEATLLTVPSEVEFSLNEPNVCLLDIAEYRYDDAPYRAEEEVYRLDNLMRRELDMPIRHGGYAQPWVHPAEPPVHTASLRFRIDSEIKVENVKLALEDADIAEVVFNGKKIKAQPDGWYVDKSIGTIVLGNLKKGENVIEITLPFGVRTNLEWCYLLGDFGVKVMGKKKVITTAPQTLSFGDITRQGLPFYGGEITYKLPVKTSGGKITINAPHYRGGLITLECDGNKEAIIYEPYNAEFNLSAGEHIVEMTLYANRHNSFGCIHNADREMRWLGPNSWRTKGNAWCYEYVLKEMGILSTPVVTEE